ncbi:vWA domain-containing protein [Bacillus xiapuensis]|uniref:vWA domain-containing protein n=1 Tax=Bacillus xiapuensis TaxID=2014075 RepID=UPI000C236848|nr:hypothetical protein [Bacillus xiapuensis]
MKRFIQFNDETVDSFLFMQLSDLAKTLTRDPEIEVEYGPHSYMNKREHVIYVSHFWNHRPQEDLWNGYKSDVFLRAAGNGFVDDQALEEYAGKAEQSAIPSFAKQLFVLAEDLRIEEKVKQLRPGTKKAFHVRRKVLRHHFQTQLEVNLVKSLSADALFSFLYLLLNAEAPIDPPAIKEKLDENMPFIVSKAFDFYEADSTKATAAICERIVERLNYVLGCDMLNEYFHLPDRSNWQEELTYHDLKRKDPLLNDDQLEADPSETAEIFNEEFRTWHRETSEPGTSFMQFDLERGTKTNLMGDGAREGEAGDQALAMAQGSAKQTSHQDFSKLQAQQLQDERKSGGNEPVFGKANRFAVPVFDPVQRPHPLDKKNYKDKQVLVAPLQKKLQRIMEKTLEFKKNQPKNDLYWGRLNKKLLRFFVDDQPRLFYKKQQPSKEMDAVFSLLVDCSASMKDKMEETKLGIVLFHEALKSLKVPHEVTGFWEDTSEATDTRQPNHFQTVISFNTSLLAASGPEIMQLTAEEDNRDGFAIRLMTNILKKRAEKQKFLLIFSDGEPAAYDYDRNGIMDTHEAVLQARKLGIEVINIFLSDGELEESQRNTVQNIYGKYSIFTSNIQELPSILFPLLKKLLYKSLG